MPTDLNMKDKQIDKQTLSKDELYQYEMWSKAKEELFKGESLSSLELVFMRKAYTNLLKADSILQGACESLYIQVKSWKNLLLLLRK